jgi:hypothetical protein
MLTYLKATINITLYKNLNSKYMKNQYIFTPVRDVEVSRDIAVCIATKGPEFESHDGQEFSILQVVQTGSGAHPASFTMGTKGSFPGVKRPGVKLTIQLQLVPG